MAKDKDKDKPGLVLISGGKAAGGGDSTGGGAKAAGAVGKAASGLTLKQEAFAVAVAMEGLSLVGAYRKAYETGAMQQKTVENEACKLAAHHGVAARIQSLLDEKQRKTAHVEARASDRIWRGVWALAEGDDTPPAVRATALGLAAKLAGMLTDKVELTTPGSAQEIEQELIARLARYK